MLIVNEQTGLIRPFSKFCPAGAVPSPSPSMSPSTSPSDSPILACPITWNLYNSRNDKLVMPITEGVRITNPPRCGSTNIEAVVPCNVTSNGVGIELYQGIRLIRNQTELASKYFLFGNKGTNVLGGKMPPGTYSIRATANGMVSPFTTFTLGGKCSIFF
jgi:hypothetical protein